MTNGDKIRAMTDEELVDSGYIECPHIYRNCTTKMSCDDCKLEYLKKEAVEEKDQ